MSVTAYIGNNTTVEAQKRISNEVTVYPIYKVKGQEQKGKPIHLIQASRDRQWITIPFHIGSKLFTPKSLYDYTNFQPIRHKMQFIGSLINDEERDQFSAMDEAMDILHKESSILLNLRTGHGKTTESLYLASQFKLLTLIVCCNIGLLENNWVGDMKYTNFKHFMIKNTKPVKIDNEYDVILCPVTRLRAISDEDANRVGMLILDEAVDFCTEKRYMELMRFHPQKIIALSATPTRSNDGLHLMLEKMIGTNSVIRKNEKPFPVTIVYTNFEPQPDTTAMGPDWTSMCYELATNSGRNLILMDILKVYSPNNKILVLTNYAAQVELINTLCGDYGLKSTTYYGNKKSYTGADILIGTVNKCGTGFDEKQTCVDFDGIRINLLVLICSVKKFEALIQYLGRAFRAKFPSVIHLTDNHPVLKRHLRLNKQTYKNSKGVITEIDEWEIKEIKNAEEFELRHNLALTEFYKTIIKRKKVHSYAERIKVRIIDFLKKDNENNLDKDGNECHADDENDGNEYYANDECSGDGNECSECDEDLFSLSECSQAEEDSREDY